MFGVVFESMLGIGFEKEELQDVYTILAAVILLGDIVSYIIPILCYNHIARVSIWLTIWAPPLDMYSIKGHADTQSL